MADKWICSYAKDFKPCYEPAVWIIEVGQLQMGACGRHRDLVAASVTVKPRILDLAYFVLEGRK